MPNQIISLLACRSDYYIAKARRHERRQAVITGLVLLLCLIWSGFGN